MPPSLEAIYRRCPYTTPGHHFTPGRRPIPRATPTPLPLALTRGVRAIMLTAHNPGGRRQPDLLNQRAQARLEATLTRLAIPFVPASSGHPPWQETQCLAAGPARRLLHLARLHRQRAVLAIRPPLPPRLIWLRPP